MKSLALVYFLFSILNLGRIESATANVKIRQNGYSDILVAISEDVPYDATIIPKIQSIITKASGVLYKATNQRAYYKSVQILIPKDWNIPSISATWELYDNADVKITDQPNPSYGDTPYTYQQGSCGQPSINDAIFYTTEYIRTSGQFANKEKFGSPEHIFVQKWAQLRYGVFEEHGYALNPVNPLFYNVQQTNVLMPNLCYGDEDDLSNAFFPRDTRTDQNCDPDPKTKKYDEQFCVYDLMDWYSSPTSLMAVVTNSYVDHFCDDSNHNKENPSKQNQMCTNANGDGESVWAVISRHPDFANNNNPPADVSNLTPTFNIVKSRPCRQVLVMDVSGSMATGNRIGRLNSAAVKWITHDIDANSSLGLVQFDTYSQILSPLITIQSQADRTMLASLIPKSAFGTTCIGCGLRDALQLLAGNNGDTGGTIILMTDGEENVSPRISDVTTEVLNSKAQVITVALTNQASQAIDTLSQQTGGYSFYIPDSDITSGLTDALAQSLKSCSPAPKMVDIGVKLFQQQMFGNSGVVANTFIVDPTVGRNMVLRIDYTTKSFVKDINIRSPSGITYNSNFENDDATKSIFFKQALAEVGKWNFTISVNNTSQESLVVRVTAETRASTVAPITAQCFFPNGADVADATTNPVRIAAAVMQGSAPVKNAKVKATFSLPNGSTMELDLFDNGALADTNGDDGVYARYFTSPTAANRYSVVCTAWNDGGAYTSRRNSSKVLIPDFSRMESGGSVRVIKPVPAANPYPPGKVRNLAVYDVNNDLATFSIQFTAPGQDLDQGGRVTRYEIKYSTRFEDLKGANFEKPNPNVVNITQAVNGTIDPSVDPGFMQFFSLKVNKAESNVTYFVAMRSFDKDGSASKVSNIADFRFRPLNSFCPNGDDWSPCTCSGGNITCANMPVSTIRSVFNRVRPVNNTLLNVDIRPVEPSGIISIPDDIFGNGKYIESLLIRCPSKSYKLQVSKNVIAPSNVYTTSITVSTCDFSTLDLSFLTGFVYLNTIKLLSGTNIQVPFKTLPYPLPRLASFNFYGSQGLNAMVDSPPVLVNGLVEVDFGACGFTNVGATKVLDWLVASSSRTLNILLLKFNSFSNVPTQIPKFTGLKQLELSNNQITQIRTGELNFTSPLTKLFITANKIASIQCNAFQGTALRAEVSLEVNKLARLESAAFGSLLQQMTGIGGTGFLYLAGNSLDCGTDPCHMAWILRDRRNYLNKLDLVKCSNGTLIKDLNVAAFTSCPTTPNACTN